MKRDQPVWITVVVLAFLSGAALSLLPHSTLRIGTDLTNQAWGDHSDWFWTMAQFWALVVGFAFTYKQIGLQARSNMLQTHESMSNKWTSEFLLSCRADACSEYTQNRLRIGSNVEAVLGFFEDIGSFRSKKVFDLDIIFDRYSYFIEHYWVMYKPAIDKFRKDTNDRTWYEKFGELFEELQRYSERRNAPFGRKSDEDITLFIQGELEASQQKARQRISSQDPFWL